MTCLRDATVFRFPDLDVRDLQVITRILRDLLDDRDHDERAHGVGCGQLVDGWIFGRPVRGRIELRAELIGGELIARGLERVSRVLVGLAGFGVDARPELRRAASDRTP